MMFWGRRAGANRQDSLPYVLAATLGGLAVLVAALTGSAGRWTSDWGFLAFYLALSFVLEFSVRLKSSRAETALQILVLAGSAPAAASWFFGDAWHDARAALHVSAVAALGVIVGYQFAHRVRVYSARRAV
jgi:hypothetical protein